MNAGRILPAGYTRLSWLMSTGVQYINTGISGNRQLDIKIRFSFGSFSLFGPIFGNYVNEGASGYRIILSNANNILLYNISSLFGGQTKSIVNPSSLIGQQLEVEFLYDGHRCFFNGVEISNDMLQSVGNNSNILLFKDRETPYSQGNINCKIYNWQVSENGVAIQRLFPARRDSDQTLGMYDVINDVFLTNVGTGTFIGA